MHITEQQQNKSVMCIVNILISVALDIDRLSSQFRSIHSGFELTELKLCCKYRNDVYHNNSLEFNQCYSDVM